ncbi:MAG: DUF2851 family protein [Marinoscillum sp.]|uniref:DUF2851 family protein n=1 Tax=Marinoscillum sp. TaxID=2024838 RepID=UPI0032FBD8C7
MDEYFLQFLWKFQKFASKELVLSNGSSLTVFQTGHQNHDSGPDFLEAKIKIDDLTWSGSVEIHYKSSDWKRHNHQTDRAYENVILHVVWINDGEILIDQEPIPTLEMSRYVSANLEQEYRRYINQPEVIRCGPGLSDIPQIQVSAMIDRAVASRLQEKSIRVLETLEQQGGDWEETAYQTLARDFGFKTNADAFQKLASSLPYHIIRKHAGKELQVYALVFGMAGFLEDPVDEYQENLRNEFEFLSKKFQLHRMLDRHHWKHSKMRPANFPSVRLSQFAAFLAQENQLLASLLNISGLKEAIGFLQKNLPDYWKSHFDFGKTTNKSPRIGTKSIENIVINSLAPVLGAYSKYLDEVVYLERAQHILEQLPPESNHVIKKWIDKGVTPGNGAETQGLIYQYQSFCVQKKCLRCNIGMSILNPPK